MNGVPTTAATESVPVQSPRQSATQSSMQAQSLRSGTRVNAARAGRISRTKAVVVRAAKTADGPRVAIVGVTGAVGQEFLQVGS